MTADDNRAANVGLTSDELKIMQNCDTYTDYENNISYFRTEERLDSASTELVISRLNKNMIIKKIQIYSLFLHMVLQLPSYKITLRQ